MYSYYQPAIKKITSRSIRQQRKSKGSMSCHKQLVWITTEMSVGVCRLSCHMERLVQVKVLFTVGPNSASLSWLNNLLLYMRESGKMIWYFCQNVLLE